MRKLVGIGRTNARFIHLSDCVQKVSRNCHHEIINGPLLCVSKAKHIQYIKTKRLSNNLP